MRRNPLIALTLCLAVLLLPSAAASHGADLSGRPLVDLEAELRADPRLYKLERLRIDDRTVLAAVLDVGSGAYVWVLQIYVDLGSVWGLAIMQRTRTGDIEFAVDREAGELIASSAEAGILLRIPYDSLRLTQPGR